MITYNAAMSACEKGDHPEMVLGLPGVTQQKGLEPNVIMYSDVLLPGIREYDTWMIGA